MKASALAALFSVAVFTGCVDRPPTQPPTASGPAALIMDGAHNGGNTNFFFLPPLVANPVNDPNFNPNTFNPALTPTAEVCTLTGDPSAGSVSCDGSGLVFGPTVAALDGTNQQYAVNWDTRSPTLLDASKFYRITVRGAPGGTPLGLLDVDPVTGGMKNVRTGEVFAFQDGRTLPIKVRIQQGAFGSTNPDHVEQSVGNVATVVTTNTGFAGASFPDGWLPAAAVAAGITNVVLIIERIPVNDNSAGTTCLSSGLLEKEGCYRFRTDPDLHQFGAFTKPAIAGVCFEVPSEIGQEGGPPLSLAKREELEGELAGPTLFLDETTAPFLTCSSFGPTQVIGAIKSRDVRALATAGLHAILEGVGRLITPQALHAVDLGAGGSTDGFSRIGWARIATMTKDATTDLQTAAPNTALAKNPRVCLTFTHHTEPQPLVNEPVTFTTLTGGGTVNGGSSAVVNTGTDGCASATWVIGSSTTPGGNTLQAKALATGSPATFTATGVAGVSLVNVILNSTTLVLDGSLVGYTATYSNGTGGTLSGVFIQANVVQGDASRGAGGVISVCGGNGGDRPPGTCVQAFDAFASNAAGGTGTLVPGAATLQFLLMQGDAILATFTVPVTLVNPTIG